MKNVLQTRISRVILMSVLTCSIVFFACKKKDKKEDLEEPVHKTAVATIQKVFNDTTVTGTATFSQMNDEDVTLTLDITVPSRANKSVAVHLHMMGDCGNNAGNAMGHWNPTNANHGKFGTGSFHLGDIGNISLDANGHALFTMTTNAWNINGSDANRNIVGRSVMIHSGVDDYTSQPTGNSGTKIGCGAIQVQ
jgi:Cu-Zn family superoxide dismutase